MAVDEVCFGQVHFGGHVQGVGFRYSTMQVARGFEVAGRVENLTDGRVRLEVEGEEREARAFVAAVRRELAAYIRTVNDRWSVRQRRFRDFQIVSGRLE